MSDRPDNTVDQAPLIPALLAAASGRLDGHWEDAAAWRVLCEEAVMVWRRYPEVAWASLVPRGELGLVPPETENTDRQVIWTRGAAATWQSRPTAETLWTQLEKAGQETIAGVETLPLTVPRVKGWLAHSIINGRLPSLALVVGLNRIPNSDLADDPLAMELGNMATFLAPLLGQRRRQVDLAAEAASVRSECETLSRLGELRARLAAVTAHELKTPLTSITAYAEVLEQQIGDPDFGHSGEFLRVIRGEADRLLRLVDRLLDSSRRGHGPALCESMPVAVGGLVEDVLRTMAPQASARELQLAARVPGDLPSIEGDSDLVRQVLVNLIGNALKFTPAGGRVVLTAREDAAMVRLSVTDNGAGIPPHELRAIFQSFYRTRAASPTEGVGLGLSIVKDIVGLHGGHLDVQSRFGRGSTFSVLLPKQLHFTEGDTALTAAGIDPALQQRLCGGTLHLIAELAASRGVAIMLPGIDEGSLVVAAELGLGENAVGLVVNADSTLARAVDGPVALVPGQGLLPDPLAAECRRPGSAMLAPLLLGDDRRPGLIMAARRLAGEGFGADDLQLLRVLSEILGNAWAGALHPDTDRRSQESILEALSALTGLRRSGVPTVDPSALRLLSRTGRRLGLSPYEVRLLQYAGALHDTGMVLLDPDVVYKPESLDTDERDHVDHHPQRGLDLLGPLVQLPGLQAVIRHHHERVDGRGYPEGRRGDAIPMGARILAVIDAFFAMIRSRPWREGLTVAAAVEEIQRHAGTQFDDRVVESFLGVLLEEGLLSGTVEVRK